MSCNHISKVIKWGVDEKANFIVELWGCCNCDATSNQPFESTFESKHKHTSYVEGCFTCKMATLQFDTGDANSGLINNGFTKKKWNAELKAYADARAQGIQPTGTSIKKVRAAVEKSNQTGTAFKAG